MSPQRGKRPRLNIEITPQHLKFMQQVLELGERKTLIHAILDHLILLHSQHGKQILYAFMSKKHSLIDLITGATNANPKPSPTIPHPNGPASS